MPRSRLLFALPLAALLVACGGPDPADTAAATGEDSLPKPGIAKGSVTGMPTPGASTPDPGRAIPPDQDALAANAAQGGSDPVVPAEPDADAAVAVLRDYYAALNARDFARAYRLWRQNPQTPAQFADGFAGTTGVSVELGAPGPIDAGAGQRFVEIPVKLDATQADGRVDRYAGRVVLHRSAVEGGDPDWRIERATLAKQ